MGLFDMLLTPAEREKRAAREAEKERDAVRTALRGGPAAAPAAVPARTGRDRYAKTPTGTGIRRVRRGLDEPAAASVAPGGSVRLVVRAPSGMVVDHPWEPLAPAGLTPHLRAVRQPEGRLFVDESGALLRYLQPLHAREDRLRYELDDRYYTTLVVREWPRDGARPGLWIPFLVDLPRRVPDLTISLHQWRITTTAATRELRVQIDKRQLELEGVIERYGAEDMRAIRLEEQVAAMRESLAGLVRQLETLFHVSCYLRVGAPTVEDLRVRVREVEEVARTVGVSLTTAPGEQRDAYMSSMPFGSDPAYYTKLRGSSATASLLPLVSRPHQERNLGRNPVVLYGISMANQTPVLMSPWNSNETIEITTVLGRMGSGKSYWVRCHLGRLAMVGVQTITIDPLGDFVRWHNQNEATIIEIAPGSPYHVNPFKRAFSGVDGDYEAVEEKIERLMPMFRLVLGEEYDVIAQGLLEGGLREFYHRFGTEERLMRDFLEVLRDFNRSSAGDLAGTTIARRERLIDTLALKCLDGALRPFFEHRTNIALDPRDPRTRRILFNLKPSGEGDLMIFASFMAITMAASICQGSMDRKILLIDELHRLFMAQRMASGIGDFLRSFVRIHRHWNTALTFATQFVDEDDANTAQESILKATGTWVLLRGTERMLEQSARLIGKDADLDLLNDTLKVSAATAEELRRTHKPMIVYRNGEAVPMFSVGLSFEDAEDDKASGIRRTGEA